MAGNTYITLVSGQQTELRANQTSAGAGDAGKIVALNASGLIDVTMLPSTTTSVTITTSANLSAGSLVNIYDDVGTPTARPADASLAQRASGYVLASSTSGANAIVYLTGIITTTGVTAGIRYYLGNSGALTSTPPSTATYISQDIGGGLSSTQVNFDPSMPVTLA